MAIETADQAKQLSKSAVASIGDLRDAPRGHDQDHCDRRRPQKHGTRPARRHQERSRPLRESLEGCELGSMVCRDRLPVSTRDCSPALGLKNIAIAVHCETLQKARKFPSTSPRIFGGTAWPSRSGRAVWRNARRIRQCPMRSSLPV